MTTAEAARGRELVAAMNRQHRLLGVGNAGKAFGQLEKAQSHLLVHRRARADAYPGLPVHIVRGLYRRDVCTSETGPLESPREHVSTCRTDPNAQF